jgi:acetyltransferase-like isoleucine patch superfamily enzyme
MYGEITMIKNIKKGKNCKIYPLVNLYGCILGNNVKVANFVEIQKGSIIGDDTTISSHSFICSNVIIGKNVFIGHGVITINDKNPIPNNPYYKCERTTIEDYASIGSGVTLLPVRIGNHAIIGAGSVVVKDIPPYALAYGNPAKVIKIMTKEEYIKRVIG